MDPRNHPLFFILPNLTTPWRVQDVPDLDNPYWETMFEAATPYQRTNISHCWVWCLAHSQYYADQRYPAPNRTAYLATKTPWVMKIAPYIQNTFMTWRNLGYATAPLKKLIRKSMP